MNEKIDKARADKIAAARARMAELAAKFVERSTGELATMRAALITLGTGDQHALAEIRHLAHRMAGTGATLGLEALSDRALEIEHLGDRLTPGVAPDATTMTTLGALMDALDRELRAVAT